MAIRQLSFDKGEEFQLRNKANRIADGEILEHLEEYLKDETTLYVKCGRSFWDVSAFPEIFEAGEEFDKDSLTSIDIKQMEKKEPPKPAFVDKILQEEKRNPLEDLYHRTDEEETEEEPEVLERRTYYLRLTDIEALTILCHETRVEVSAMVREIFERGISSIADEMNCGDVYARAKENIANGVGFKKKSLKKPRR